MIEIIAFIKECSGLAQDQEPMSESFWDKELRIGIIG